MDEHFVQFETQLAFQERALEKLNEVVVAQQCQIDELEKQVKILANKLRDIALLEQEKDPEQPPPHY